MSFTEYAHCWASGEIFFTTERQIAGTIVLGSGSPEKLRSIVSGLARHGYEKGVLLVPGVPEADTDNDAVDAASRFSVLLCNRLKGRSAETICDKLTGKGEGR